MVKKKRQQKKLPAILKSPISYGLEFLLSLSTGEKAGLATFIKQVDERVSAAYEYFEIDPVTPDAKDRLIFAMCSKLFPQGFSVRGGKKRKSTQGNTRKRTVERKLALVRFVKEFESVGLFEKQAIYELYGNQQKPPLDANSVKARHSEAVKTLESDFKALDLADQLEFLEIYLERKITAELLLGTEIKS
jgi:hypothetical protein